MAEVIGETPLFLGVYVLSAGGLMPCAVWNGIGRLQEARNCIISHRSPDKFARLLVLTTIAFQPRRHCNIHMTTKTQAFACPPDEEFPPKVIVLCRGNSFYRYSFSILPAETWR